jgi:hypothetical protein
MYATSFLRVQELSVHFYINYNVDIFFRFYNCTSNKTFLISRMIYFRFKEGTFFRIGIISYRIHIQ